MGEVYIDIEKEHDNKSCLLEINEEEINKIELNPFEKIYRNLGKEIREKKEENINLKDLLNTVEELNKLYSENTKKILLIGGVNVLLPIFEILYKQKNNIKKSEFNSILIELCRRRQGRLHRGGNSVRGGPRHHGDRRESDRY